MFSLVGCSTLAPRSDPANALNTANPSQTVGMTGSNGRRLTQAQREQVLASLQAEGKADLLNRHLAVISAQEGVELYRGNSAQLLIDGPQAFAAMFAAIEGAREQVLLESYIIEDTAVAAKLADLLIRKTASGVPTFVIYDDIGSATTSTEFFARLRNNGVAVCAFNPINPLKRPGYWGITHRDHRKILVVDAKVAFTGGINISQVYASGSGTSSSGYYARRRATRTEDLTKEGWRDTQIELRGPVVAGLGQLVRETWNTQGCKGEPLALKAATASQGDRVVQVLAAGPDMPDNRIYTTLLSAIDTSQRSVHLTMAYFAPGPDMLAALCDAAQRGVQVEMVMPSRSDSSLILYAGRSYYRTLLDSGVRIFELQTALLHAKAAVIDGVLSTIGSSNMDWRSFTGNNEANVLILGEDFAGEMERVFRQDVTASREITLEQWKQRPLSDRAQEWMGRALERLL